MIIRCRKCGNALPRELGAGVRHLATCDPYRLGYNDRRETTDRTTMTNDNDNGGK